MNRLGHRCVDRIQLLEEAAIVRQMLLPRHLPDLPLYIRRQAARLDPRSIHALLGG